MKSEISTIRFLFEKDLTENILPFWITKSPDRVNGGFNTHIDQDGTVHVQNRMLIMQTRMIWSFAWAYRNKFGGQECLDLATHGVKFLLGTMRDQANGGFYTVVTPAGAVVDRTKDVYMQTFVVYALAEYAQASGDKQCLAQAMELYRLLKQRACDPATKSYPEVLAADWQPIRGEWQSTKAGNERDRRQIKTLDTHLHFLECLTTLYQASGDAGVKQDLNDILHILTERMINPVTGAGINEFDLALNPLPARVGKGVSFGHDIEMAWLGQAALDVLGGEPKRFTAIFKRMIDFGMEHGWDRQYGGIYTWGDATGAITDDSKVWWQQSETLIGALTFYRLTGEARYWDYFQKLSTYVRKFFLDEKCGEWYHALDRQGKIVVSEKGGNWKAAYHVVRSYGRCLQLLRELEQKPN